METRTAARYRHEDASQGVARKNQKYLCGLNGSWHIAKTYPPFYHPASF